MQQAISFRPHPANHNRSVRPLVRYQSNVFEIPSFRWPPSTRQVKKQPWRELLPEPYEFEIPFLDSEGTLLQGGKHSALLPHEVFNTVFHTARPICDDIFCGGDALADWFAADCLFDTTCPPDADKQSNVPLPCVSGIRHKRSRIGQASGGLVLNV